MLLSKEHCPSRVCPFLIYFARVTNAEPDVKLQERYHRHGLLQIGTARTCAIVRPGSSLVFHHPSSNSSLDEQYPVVPRPGHYTEQKRPELSPPPRGTSHRLLLDSCRGRGGREERGEKRSTLETRWAKLLASQRPMFIASQADRSSWTSRQPSRSWWKMLSMREPRA